MASRLRLPPLPLPNTWSQHFSRERLAWPPDKNFHRDFPGRFTLTNRNIADEFARALKIRPNEVIVETFGGAGVLTRSLLNGGNPEDTSKTAAEWVAEKGHARIPNPVKSASVDFPTWRDELARHHLPTLPVIKPLPLPRLVVACEPSSDFLVRGLGMPRAQIPPPIKLGALASSRSVISAAAHAVRKDGSKAIDTAGASDVNPIHIHQSTIEPNLLLSPTTPYVWSTLPGVLSHELVESHIEKYDDQSHRPWSAPAPAITVVGQICGSVVGEQMLAQWISSAIGAAHNGASWIWAWGRVRLALIVPKSQYDRIIAKPGETINCKQSVMANAIFHITPLPPLHHVANVDKSSVWTEDRPANATKAATYVPPTERTITYPADFWPNRKPRSEPYPRAPFLGLLFEPRETSIVLPEQKDAWDFVLRKCFVREAIPIRDAVKTLGFGADKLVQKIELITDEYRGRAVKPDTLVRDLEEDEWARVVDVFDKWSFRPKNLILDMLPVDETVGRVFGQTLG